MLSVKQSGKVSLKDFWLLNCFPFNVSYLVEVYTHYPEVIYLAHELFIRHQGHGELQGGDEAVWTGTKRRDRDLAKPVLDPV